MSEFDKNNSGNNPENEENVIQNEIEQIEEIKEDAKNSDDSAEETSENIAPETEEDNFEEDDIEEYIPLSKRILKEIVSWILCIAIAFGAAMVIRTWVFTVVRVDGPSMNPTLEHNQRLFTQIIAYTPKRGDVIIFHPKSHPDIAYVKRIIATEGDRIWIDEQTAEVHLKKKGSDTWETLKEDYILEPSFFAGIAQKYEDSTGEGLLIEEDHVFVMGDNRNNSTDSRIDYGDRAVGQVHVDSIIGKVFFRWWPIGDIGTID